MNDEQKFAKMINKRMSEFIKKEDEYTLSKLSFENLIELQKMVMSEIEKRAGIAVKEIWENANIVKIGEINISEYKQS